jgi:hypothetical protein
MVQGRRVDGSYRVGEVSRVTFGVGYYDGLVVAAEIQSNVAKLVDMITTLQKKPTEYLGKIDKLEKLCTELTQNNNSTIPSSQEHSTETQQNDTNLLGFLSSDYLTTLLQDSTETEHSPTSLPTAPSLPTNMTTPSLPTNTMSPSLPTNHPLSHQQTQ